MKIYVFEYLSGITDNYHDGGGLVVVAKDMREVKKLVSALPDVGDLSQLKADAVYKVDGPAESKVFVFPDAGCC